jgi:ribonuclease VapC
MIVVDTSALMAIVLNEPKSEACIKALQAEAEVLISAGTLAEAFVVSSRRRVGSAMARLLDNFDFEIETVTPLSAQQIGQGYERWGKGIHPAGLNFGDCFAYALAKERSCPLLFVGDDFSKTDVASAL